MRTKDMFFVCHACAKNIITPASASKIMYKVRKDLAEMFGFDTKHRISLKIVNRNTLTKESGMATSLGCMKYRFQKIVRWKGKSRKIRYKHTCQIFLLDTLNINNAGGVLAHELTHDYLFHHMGKPVDSQVSEGICEAVAGAWLLQNGYEKQFRIKKQNPDPVYGAGFRLIYPQLERLGFKKMLEQNRSGFKRFR
ncbi:MAG: protein DA1 [Lentisphaeria bacterium]|nr:protein DA1 [Lentisphaeria bacterium]